MLNRRSILTASIAAALGRFAPSLPAAEQTGPNVKLILDNTAFIAAINSLRHLLDVGALSDDDQRQIADMHETNGLCVFREGVKEYATIWYMLPSQSLQRMIERAQAKTPASPTSAAWLHLVSAMG